ncbi:uncharacterized protein A4U43_C02F19390 [Asparagus officinalis]|uniref:Uncharacterized protein n=1 Tax=Asparagus officinalis TaxID=4686 RepID=A0A5P1FJK6_ASPOF|nr:uncharacterized protein A4U43_C02F19390 [Asparagus officinalis]
MNKTKKDSEGCADVESGVAAIMNKRTRNDISSNKCKGKASKEEGGEASSSLPSTSSSLSAFVPCKEAEAFNQLISTLDEKQHTVFDQEEEVDERQVIGMLLKEHEAMKNNSDAAVESDAPTSVCEQAATYVQDSLQKRKWLVGCSNFFDTENSSTVNIEASSWPSSSSPCLSSSWLCASALDSYEASSSLVNILPPAS